MNENELHDLLENLHSQIEHTQTIDEKDLEQLRDLEADIRALLDRSSKLIDKPQPTVLQQLEKGIGTFEVSHPTIAVTLTEVMAILSNAGI